MKFTITAASLLLAGSAFLAAPAIAQSNYGAPSAPQQTAAQGQQQDDQKPGPKPKISREAVNAVKALDAAVKANNGADVAAKAQAANAVAKTADDKYMISVLQYQYAVAAKDDAMRAAAIEGMLASGFKGAPPLVELYKDLGSTYARLKQPQKSLDAYQHLIQVDPNSVDATIAVAEAKVDAGQAAEGLALFQKGIALQSAGGAKAPESWYKRALQIAWKAKLPQATQLARDWVAAYPGSDSWVNALSVYQNLTALDEAHVLDLMRLKRAVKVLTPSDYFKYGDLAVQKGFPGETKAVLELGFAANAIDKNNASFSQLYALANQRSQGDRASLPAAPAADLNAHRLMVLGDAYYGYADFAKAADFYRAALAKSDADANLGNLHLGMALAAAGDKAGATAAFGKVGGDYADLAKFWLLAIAGKA